MRLLLHDADRDPIATALARFAPTGWTVAPLPTAMGQEPGSSRRRNPTIPLDPAEDVVVTWTPEAAAELSRFWPAGLRPRIATRLAEAWPRSVAQAYDAYFASDLLVVGSEQYAAGLGRLPRLAVATDAGQLWQAMTALSGAASTPALPVDLTEEVTVFVTTVGTAAYPLCRALLDVQDARFRLEVIAGVAPMSAAFQRMLDTCRTPYYVQVDEDMLLHPHAIRRLHTWIEAAPPHVALCGAGLYDVQLRRAIDGVKIFRHEIVRRFPFAEGVNFEKDQVGRLAAHGYRYERLRRGLAFDPETVLGLHGVHWRGDEIYERYRALELRCRARGIRSEWAEQELASYRTDPGELTLLALLGALSGIRAEQPERAGSKSFTDRDLAGWPEARAFAAAIARPAKPAAVGLDAGGMPPRELLSLATAFATPDAVTPLPSNTAGRPSAYRLRFDDGTLAKGRVYSSEGRARRVATLLGGAEPGPLPRLLAHARRVLLLEWIEGESLANRLREPRLLDAAAELQARLHAMAVPAALLRAPDGFRRQAKPGAGPMGAPSQTELLRPQAPDGFRRQAKPGAGPMGAPSQTELLRPQAPGGTASLAERLEEDLQFLVVAGLLDAKQAARIRAAAKARRPARGGDQGVIHRDFCPENLVVTPSGALRVADEETLTIGSFAFDLARTWYRWPLDDASLARYLAAYARLRDPGPFAHELPFWGACAAAAGARHRAQFAPAALGLPLGRLALLAAAADR